MKSDTHATTEAHSGHDAAAEHGINLIDPNVNLMILTWVSFFIVLAILQKFAWKPILAALEKREDTLRKSLEEAEKIRLELEKINETRENILNEADQKAKEIVEESRNAAAEAAKAIQEKAKEESSILLKNATREIKSEQEKAMAELKETGAQIAIDLAGKIIEENLDKEKNRKLVNRFIKEL